MNDTAIAVDRLSKHYRLSTGPLGRGDFRDAVGAVFSRVRGEPGIDATDEEGSDSRELWALRHVPLEVIEQHLRSTLQMGEADIAHRTQRRGRGGTRVVQASIHIDGHDDAPGLLVYGQPATVRFEVSRGRGPRWRRRSPLHAEQQRARVEAMWAQVEARFSHGEVGC